MRDVRTKVRAPRLSQRVVETLPVTDLVTDSVVLEYPLRGEPWTLDPRAYPDNLSGGCALAPHQPRDARTHPEPSTLPQRLSMRVRKTTVQSHRGNVTCEEGRETQPHGLTATPPRQELGR